MEKNKKSILQTKEGYTITVRQAQWKIRSLRNAKARDPELFELNGGSLDLLLLYQFVQEEKKWNGVKSEVGVISEAERQLLYRKIESVVPDTYPCGVPIKASEG